MKWLNQQLKGTTVANRKTQQHSRGMGGMKWMNGHWQSNSSHWSEANEGKMAKLSQDDEDE